MKRFLLILLTMIFSVPVFSQLFKEDDLVEVDPLQSESKQGTWKKAEIIRYDTTTRTYTVKLSGDGEKITIASKEPEKWIRPVAKPLAMLGPSRQIRYENRHIVMKAFSCKPSEIYIKRNVKALLAIFHKDYSNIYVDFTSFKAQNGYDDPKNKGQQIYPYKIEMVVYLKRTLFFGGKAFTEYQTWEYDREYNYATRPKNKCEFYPAMTNEPKLLSSGWFE